MVFEDSLDVNQDDPLKKCFEYARQARIYADTIQGQFLRFVNKAPDSGVQNHIDKVFLYITDWDYLQQDFNREYSAIAKKCEEFAKGWLGTP